jgi:phage terminase small subunit
MGIPRRPQELRDRLGDPSKGAEPTKSKRIVAPSGHQAGRIPKSPPSDLDAKGKKTWREITRYADWLVMSDMPALHMLCRLQSKVDDLLQQDKLNSGETSMIKLQFDLFQRFGLDPSSRLQMGLAVAETESKLSAFRNEHK